MTITNNSTSGLTDRQAAIIEFIFENPGCSIADAHRGAGAQYGISGHRFFYAAVSRLRKRGVVRGVEDGPRVRLYVADAS